MTTLPDPPDPSDAAGTREDESTLVVVGSSAGGIEALSKLVSTLPAGFPAPVVLAQHLDPTKPSHLGEILARYSHLPVQTVTDHAPLEAGTVYVIPSDRNVEVTDHTLRLRADGPGKRPMPSINLLFSSAADAFGERLIAIILTGTGSDGASGAYQVKHEGGLVIIENPETAAYPALPASLAPTTVDFVADLERIGPLLYELLTKPEMPVSRTLLSDVAGAPDGSGQEATDPSRTSPRDEAERNNRSLQHLLNQVQRQSNIDFSQYKLPTIVRRLQRRMFATNSPDLGAYQQYLDAHPDEYLQLVSSFLIKVTEFFRDSALFTSLKERILPELIEQARKRGNVLRLWSAGCATGEEAYSLAILVAEILDKELDQFSVQIFATDVDEGAVEYARRGIFPAAALAGISPQRLARFFHKLDGNYQIIKSVRGLVIFGLHDLGLSAPFPHMDLVLCRNVLMYFTRELQSRALQAFAFSLRNGGYLALGAAESTSPAAEYFTPVSPTLKLYRRIGNRVLFPMPVPMPIPETLKPLAPGMARRRARAPSNAGAGASAAVPVGKPRLTAQELVLQEAHNTRERLGLVVLGLPAGVVVVDRHYDIQIINSAAMRLLDIFTDPLGEDLIHLARSIPSAAFKRAIDAAFRGELRPLEPEPLVSPRQPTGPFGVLEGVVTVDTLLGEQRSLQFTCYPFIGSLAEGAAQEAISEDPPAQGSVGAGSGANNEAPANEPATAGRLTQDNGTATGEEETGAGSMEAANTQAQTQQTADVPLVLILIRDVTEEAQQYAQRLRASARQHEVSQAEQAYAKSESEATAERLHSENARLADEIQRMRGINRSLLEGNQQLAATNLALRTSNEDLQLSEEEAEAGAEEVKTLNEELQASNEELMTLNEELEATIEELHAANDELQARTRELQEMAAKLEAKRQDKRDGPE